jgi:hypothetical protein
VPPLKDCRRSCTRPPRLMARVGEEFPSACPECGGDIRLIAFIADPGPIRKIPTHLGEPLDSPPTPASLCCLVRQPAPDLANTLRPIRRQAPTGSPLAQSFDLVARGSCHGHDRLLAAHAGGGTGLKKALAGDGSRALRSPISHGGDRWAVCHDEPELGGDYPG